MANQKLNQPRVSIIIINWNGLADTSECLDSLKLIDYPNYEIVLVDNASAGNEADALAKRYGSGISLIRNDKNYGFTGGSNRGIAYALDHGSDYVLLLNNDTVVTPGFLTALVNRAERDEGTGIAGAKILSYDTGRIQFVWGGMNLWSGQPSYTPAFLAEKIKAAPADKGQYDEVRQVTCVSGCCMLIKTKLLRDIGLLDESYFAYLEDVEFCLRAGKRGYKVVYVPSAAIRHKGGRSGDRKGGFAVYLTTRNRFRLMKRHASKIQYACFLLYYFGLYWWISSIYYAVFYRNPGLVRSLFHGIHDGWLEKDKYSVRLQDEG